MTFVDGVSAFGLPAADDPVTALFCFGERVQMTCRNLKEIDVEDDFDACIRVPFAAMNNLCSKQLLEMEEKGV